MAESMPMRARVGCAVLASLLVALGTVVLTGSGRASADSYVPVSGAGSTWSANALNQWIADVQQYGIRVNYAPTGSSDGRHQFLNGTVDFAASDIPFQSHPEDGSQPELPAAGDYAYMPITAGGTVFMYNLVINGQRVTNLRLSGQNITKIFTGAITNWSDPALVADNPQLALPNRAIVPVVRSDGSGSTAQFTLWMLTQYPALWNAYCGKAGRGGQCGETSYYPTITGMIAQSGDLGVAGYVAQSYAQGAIGYVNYSYALNARFPVTKMLNAAGYYTEPTPQNVAVSLLKAQINTTDTDPSLYLTQQLGGVYNDADPRAYPLSSYSYLILPLKTSSLFTSAKGKTLAAFSYYAMCQGQQESASLGYSPMPKNLVEAAFGQITKIPGAVVQNIDINSCKNPTFSPTSPNLLADTAPQPQACDKQGPTQCATGTGGAKQSTPGSGAGASGGGTSAGSVAKAGPGASSGGKATGATAARGGAAAVSGAAAAGGSAGSGGGADSAAATQACDPSTGTCGSGTGTADPSSAGTAGLAAAATPATLSVKKGWTSTQTLMLLISLLVLALVLAPGLTLRYLNKRSR